MFSCVSTRTANCTHEIVLLRKKIFWKHITRLCFRCFQFTLPFLRICSRACPNWLNSGTYWLNLFSRGHILVTKWLKTNNILAQFVIAILATTKHKIMFPCMKKMIFEKRVHNGGLCTRFIIVKTKFHILF